MQFPNDFQRITQDFMVFTYFILSEVCSLLQCSCVNQALGGRGSPVVSPDCFVISTHTLWAHLGKVCVEGGGGGADRRVSRSFFPGDDGNKHQRGPSKGTPAKVPALCRLV